MAVPTPFLHEKPSSRADYFLIVRTALAAGEYSFARQAVSKWLTAFPGDLRANLYYASALKGEKRFLQAAQVLQKLCILDPEDLDAVKMLINVIELMKNSSAGSDASTLHQGTQDSSPQKEWSKLVSLEMTVRSHRFALEGPLGNRDEPASWGGALWLSRQAMEKGELNLAKGLLEEIVNQKTVHPLAGITHLQYLGMDSQTSGKTRVETANEYYQRSPDTLYFIIRLADWLLEAGPSDFAVALLHQAVSRDIEGRVVQRLWGRGHPYSPLWPKQLQLLIDFMIPGIIVKELGWNRLPAGTDCETLADSGKPVKADPAEQIDFASNDLDPPLPVADRMALSVNPVFPSSTPDLKNADIPAPQNVLTTPQRDSHSQSKEAQNKEVLAVENELERLAARFNKKGITLQDGRFPIYVIFSIRKRLCSVYGKDSAKLVEDEMHKLVEIIRRRPGWGGRVFFADDPACTVPLGAKPAKLDDPWGCKLLLTDLDAWLSKRGERIGALLIVGGPEIVPFHHLPNPVDDPDLDVPSDNPFATRDDNYFMPEWPVGRLPGGAGGDARGILEALRSYQSQHASFRQRFTVKESISNWLKYLARNMHPNYRRSFGYSAEIWREAAAAVFSAIGRPGWMRVSPPAGMEQNQSDMRLKQQNGLKGIPNPSGKIAYFNLHGKVDAPEWFGHRDPLHFTNEPDYPVALRPQDIKRSKGSHRAPQVVFSEACYGMHIADRTLDEAIALRFLEAGSSAIVGSTCMAYGSVSAAPMVAADLLGFTFWRFLRQGMVAGEALRQAKIFVASEMNRRQDFLDGEDQKTLISFVLYGDPLADPIAKNRTPKSVRLRAKPLATMRTVSDWDAVAEAPQPVPLEVMDGVRRAVAKYLPGMIDARLAYVCEPHPERDNCSEDTLVCDRVHLEKNYKLKNRSDREIDRKRNNFRSLVTLSKQVGMSGDFHLEIARLTLDEQGKLVKLVVSR